MKRATQEDVDKFFRWAIEDPDIYPYLSVDRYTGRDIVEEDDWKSLSFISECGKCYLRIVFDRCAGLDIKVALYSKSPILAGRAIEHLKKIIPRYKPRAINSIVHGSNEKSIRIHKKIFGEPWGIEPSVAWNMGTGQYDDLLHFRLFL